MIIFGVGETLFSGADNAFLYVTLKKIKKEKIYAKIDGRSNAFFSIGSVIGGFIGAYLFTLNISYLIQKLQLDSQGHFFLFKKERTRLPRKKTITWDTSNQFRKLQLDSRVSNS